MNIRNIFKNEFVFTILQIIFMVIGFLMIFMEMRLISGAMCGIFESINLLQYHS